MSRRFLHDSPRLVALALLPMSFGAAGAWLDERQHLGFSTWLSACRAEGVSWASIASFTVQLLPAALVLALSGALLVQIFGLVQRARPQAARISLAAHGGCLIGMGVGLWLCARALPWRLALGAEALLAVAMAACLYRLLRHRSCGASVKPRTQGLASA